MLGIIGIDTASNRHTGEETGLIGSRALAGGIAGFFLAAAITGLACWLAPGSWQYALLPSLLAFFPLWCMSATAAFAFTNARRAWLGLGSAAVAGFVLLVLLRSQNLAQ